ncbi:hypothetical protein K435DRAFT_864370 [Dendrothele bispora CBS 962.96]|uniref:Uncharacterized protein n=1 Tax=Dendrothele bispora (strain CBS 962.96) TaxID=1314807 RepID=A0A4S8LM25_DENBC|nr:hypothetical protein K435DRAFT_864370 [Dendrothele bispora CBS 962.96]
MVGPPQVVDQHGGYPSSRSAPPLNANTTFCFDFEFTAYGVTPLFYYHCSTVGSSSGSPIVGTHQLGVDTSKSNYLGLSLTGVKHLSFLSYTNLLPSTPTSTLPLSSFTTGTAAFAIKLSEILPWAQQESVHVIHLQYHLRFLVHSGLLPAKFSIYCFEGASDKFWNEGGGLVDHATGSTSRRERA